MKWTKRKQKEREELIDQLHAQLTFEIRLRQEILTNLTEQEYLLLTGDLEGKQMLHQECQSLAKKLSQSAKVRKALIRKISLLFPEFKNPEETETLILHDQLYALVEKIHAQKIRNKSLYALIENQGAIPLNSPAIQTQLIEKEAKKSLLITIEYPENEKPL